MGFFSKNTAMGYHASSPWKRIFPTQGSNPWLPQWQVGSSPTEPLGKPNTKILLSKCSAELGHWAEDFYLVPTFQKSMSEKRGFRLQTQEAVIMWIQAWFVKYLLPNEDWLKARLHLILTVCVLLILRL